MGLPGPARPRVSRETRLLLATILISIAVLWALARLRFPDRPAATNPVPPLLTQLAAPAGFDDLASEISTLETRLLPSLVQAGNATALRVRDAIGAILLADSDAAPASADGGNALLARDPASGLTLVRIPGAPAPELTPWTAQRPERSRYLVAGGGSPQGASIRPVFVGRLQQGKSPAWQGPIWLLPIRTDVRPGDFLFTMGGALVGVVIAHAGGLALVPGATVLREVDGLIAGETRGGGWLGVEAQSNPAGTAGVIVSWIDPSGPAAGQLFVLDAIEAIGGEGIASADDWRVRVARLSPGQSIVLRVRRGGEAIDVPLVAAGTPAPADPAALGLTLRTVRQSGAEVVRVVEGSAAARAGIRSGDVITAIGGVRAPTAQQVARLYAAAPDTETLLVAVTRGGRHHILVLKKK